MGEIYSKVGLTKEEIKAIVDAGLCSPVTLIHANTMERLEDMAKDSGLTAGTLLECEHLALCLDWSRTSAGENFATELTTFSAEKFQAFDPSNPPATAEEAAITNKKEIDKESIQKLSINNENTQNLHLNSQNSLLSTERTLHGPCFLSNLRLLAAFVAATPY